MVKYDKSTGKHLPLVATQIPLIPCFFSINWCQGDLWIAVDGLVANLTDFATSHPGGVDLLVQHAGARMG